MKGGEGKMSSEGEFYITNTITYEFQDFLDKHFGKGKWYLDRSEYVDLRDVRHFPNTMIITVREVESDKKIGEIEVKNKFVVEEDIRGKYIEVYPESIRIRKIFKKVKNLKRRR